MMGINEMYCVNHKLTSYGIEGYKTERKYQSNKDKLPLPTKQQQKKRETQRGHYLQDQNHQRAGTPGPADYQVTKSQRTAPSKLTKQLPQAKKLTYIGQIFEKGKKQKRPAPGSYDTFKGDKQLRAQKKRLALRKISYADRATYLDGVQYEASMTPGVGSYNTPLARPKSANLLKRNKTSTVGLRCKAHKQQRIPGIGSYNPQIGEHKSFARKKKGYSEWGKVQRFCNARSSSSLGPGAYIRGDEDRVVGRRSTRSIYY